MDINHHIVKYISDTLNIPETEAESRLCFVEKDLGVSVSDIINYFICDKQND